MDPVGGEECTVEVFADGGRLRDLVSLAIGRVLHPDDLAADKVLALRGRARPRDFFDVRALMDHYETERLLQARSISARTSTLTRWRQKTTTVFGRVSRFSAALIHPDPCGWGTR